MSRPGAARRNRALRKIRASHSLPPEIKLTTEALLDLLSAQSDYQLAWPSAARLARQTGKSRRTILWHIKTIEQLNIFHVRQFTPDEAVEYVYGKYRFAINLDRCRHQAPNLFEVNTDHPLWNKSRTIPQEMEREWEAIVRHVNSARSGHRPA
ncbi:MAG: hypothetical protein R6U98_35440 [Pirellulaceae bacterium]